VIMRRRTALGLLAALLAGCATARPALKTAATGAERERAEACHVRAITEAEAAVPYVPTSKRQALPDTAGGWAVAGALSPVLVAVGLMEAVPAGALALAASPVWVPWWLIHVRHRRQEIYQRVYETCWAEAPGEAAEVDAEAYWP
jgi:hypothetical protein